MDCSNLKYKIKTATTEQIYAHLKDCNNNFVPPLDQNVNLPDYSKKLFERSVTFEAWLSQSLKGLIAAYFTNTVSGGYITNVSVTKDYKGKGIASALMKMAIEYAEKNKFTSISLEVSQDNTDAINLYKKFNFFHVESEGNGLIMKVEIK